MEAPIKTKVKENSKLKANKKLKTVANSRVIEFLNDRKKSNYIIDFIKNTEESVHVEIIAANVRHLHDVFTAILERDQMYLPYSAGKVPDTGLTTEEEYKVWLQRRYEDTTDRLMELLQHKHTDIQDQSLSTLIAFVQSQSHHPLLQKASTFPVKLLQSIVTSFLSPETDQSSVITSFHPYLLYDDCRYYCIKCILDILKAMSPDCPEPLLNNAFSILSAIKLTEGNDNTLDNFLGKAPDDVSKVMYTNPYNHRKMYTNAWVNLLRKTLPTSMYKKVLLILSDKIMPNMTSPLLLADFLTNSYNIGGAISVLAMNGLFILVYYHNLDYPEFYTKLYALFEPSVFHVKYKARFLSLADKFLTSSHIPSYLVAAFVKRLARLSLTAPCSAQVVIIPFIYNLIIRHPNCAVLLNRHDSHTDVSTDPYDATELDPAKCHALDSSLWEIQTLQHHAYHKVSRLATQMNYPLPKEEFTIGGKLDTDYDMLFEREEKKKVKTASVTFAPPLTLLDKGQIWSLH